MASSLGPADQSSVSECHPSSEPCRRLTDLPNELLVHILMFLDTRSVMQLMGVCQRLRAVARDPLHWSTISWHITNHIGEVKGFELATMLSRDTVRQLSLSSFPRFLRISMFLDRLLSCRCLQRVTLNRMVFLEKEMLKLLQLPALTYLHVDPIQLKMFKVIMVSEHRLKTLSVVLEDPRSMDYLRTWSCGYNPPDLRMSIPLLAIVQSEIEEILSFPHSTDHNAFLTFYCWATEEFIPLYPRLQFQFSPHGSLLLSDSDSKNARLAVSRSKPGGSNHFSSAVTEERCETLEAKVRFDEICHRLTELRLILNDKFSPSYLERMAVLCPNLLQLDLQGSHRILADLKGLSAVASNCPKLRVLNLFKFERSQVRNVELWSILASMPNLRVLFVSICLLPRQSTALPNLTAISIRTPIGPVRPYSDMNKKLTILAGMPSLRALKLNRMPPLPVGVGMSRLLHASTNLTHLYLVKEKGGRLSLPTDSSCYANLRQMLLEDDGFVVSEELADTLAQCKKLSILILKVSFIPSKEIIKLASSLEMLSVFHIYISSNREFESNYEFDPARVGRPRGRDKATLFAKSLAEIAKKEGKAIDICVNIKHPHLWNKDIYLFEWFSMTHF